MPDKEEEKWGKSKSKAILRRGILNGTIKPTMSPEAVYAMDLDEHKKWDFKNWKANLARLQSAISRERIRMARDARDFGHDKAIVMKSRGTNEPTPWHLSTCPKLLKKHVDDGLHLSHKPKELHALHEEYQVYDLAVFRNHIYQEIDSRNKRETRFERKKAVWKRLTHSTEMYGSAISSTRHLGLSLTLNSTGLRPTGFPQIW